MISPISIYFARRIGVIDKPGKGTHKIHSVPTPLAGGTALILCLVMLSFFLGLWNDEFTRALIIATTVVYFFGLWDDVRGLSALPKLLGQVLACFILIISHVSVHFVESVFSPLLSPTTVAWFDTALTLLWLIGVTNAMNMIDSMDGIAIGISGIAFVFFILATSLSGQIYLTKLSIVLLGIAAGIYFYNVTPARLFLGDSGSQTFGFIVAAIAMEYAPAGLSPISSWFVPILLVGIPVFDTSLVVYSRMRRGLPIYQANLDHTYHRLVTLGFDRRRAVLIIHMAAILLSLLAFATFYLSPVIANMVFGMILLIGIVMIIFFDHHK